MKACTIVRDVVCDLKETNAKNYAAKELTFHLSNTARSSLTVQERTSIISSVFSYHFICCVNIGHEEKL